MNHLGNWVMGATCALMAVGGLFIASGASNDVAYYGGIGFFVFAVLLVFLFIKVSTGQMIGLKPIDVMPSNVDVSNSWKVGGISIVGFSHDEEDIPCQDAHAFKINKHGLIIAAIADGAGSSRLSDIGAQAFVNGVVDQIWNLPPYDLFDDTLIRSEIVKSVNQTRDQLVRRHAVDLEEGTPSLSDFAATLVVAVAGPDAGAFFHVGDGAGVAFTYGREDQGITVSKPQNGEYANETYFLTMDNWQQYLRVTPFINNHDTILLMSDGVTPMAMLRGCSAPAFENFVNPVVKFLRDNDVTAGEVGIKNTLSADNVRKITGDDKTILWAIRSSNDRPSNGPNLSLQS